MLLPELLPSLVEAKFSAAKASSSLLFSPSEVTTIRTWDGVPFQLRYCPTLAKKPTKQADSKPQQKTDPFENPPKDLHIADIPTTNPSHILVLNKFPIIAEHFILATKPDKKQKHKLEKGDLEATYACLKAWQDASAEDSKQRRLFAFFNSGDHSGASQPHRHLQFLPVESMHVGEATSGWDLLIDLIHRDGTSRCESFENDESKTTYAKPDTKSAFLQHSRLPFTHFALAFEHEPSGEDLNNMYTKLLSAARSAVGGWITSNPGKLALHAEESGDISISYNLAMTTTGLAIMPRRSEGTMLREDDGTDIGFVALNGTTLGGTMMVKHQAEWDALRNKPGMLDQVLHAIGIPRASIVAQSNI